MSGFDMENRRAAIGRMCRSCLRSDSETSWSTKEDHCGACRRRALRTGFCDCGAAKAFSLTGDIVCPRCSGQLTHMQLQRSTKNEQARPSPLPLPFGGVMDKEEALERIRMASTAKKLGLDVVDVLDEWDLTRAGPGEAAPPPKRRYRKHRRPRLAVMTPARQVFLSDAPAEWKAPDGVCLAPDCGSVLDKHGSRGLCHKHYECARCLVAAGLASWEDLETQGMIRPRDPRGSWKRRKAVA